MPWFEGLTTSGAMVGSGLGSSCYVTTTATTSYTNTIGWITNNQTYASTCIAGTTMAWYDAAQNCYFVGNQRFDRQDLANNRSLYYNDYNQYANQQQLQPQISRQEQDRRNAQREQSLYEKALSEHNDQEAARLRRLIDAREQAAATQRAIDERNRQEAATRQRERDAAKDRAKELLFEHLTEAQRKTYTDHGWFVVEGGRSKTKYRINIGHLTGNVDVLDANDRKLHRLCAHPRLEVCPMGDHLLAQKITLELDEDAFLSRANRHAA